MSNDRNSAGLLVLGMHRSGTSALAGILGIGGADLGARVLGASAGNETGHWEDAVAVELHEELLLRFGVEWSDPFGLPGDWRGSEAASDAKARIARYLDVDRAAQPLWAAKDPRLCLFAGLWRDAARQAGIEIGGVLVLRSPGEVAASLNARDGIGVRRAQLLWLDYMHEAASALVDVPHAVVGYGRLLRDWRSELAKIRALPGFGALDFDGERGSGVDKFLDPARRHHRIASSDTEDALVADAWRSLEESLEHGRITPHAIERLSASSERIREIVRPLFDESRLQTRRLWERTARAEAQLAEEAARLLPRLDGLQELVQRQHSDVVSLYSRDIRRMQDVTAQALANVQAAERARADAEKATERQEAQIAALSARCDAESARAEALAADVRAADAHSEALASALEQSLREHAALTAELEPLREKARWLEQIRNSHSWALTRPLRVMRRVLTGKLSAADGDEAKSRLHRFAARTRLLPDGWRRKFAAASVPQAPARLEVLPDATSAPILHLAARDDALPDVFVWAVIDWHFRTQRPQHLARALAAKGHRVFYISNNFTDAAEPGFRVEPLDGEGRLFQLHLNLEGAPGIYFGMPDQAQVERMRESLARALEWTCTNSSISLVQHPYWTPLIRAVPNARVVYDCMDHHAGFSENATAILEAEDRLVTDSDLVIVTSGWLEDEIKPRARATALVRNAGEFGFFRQAPAEVFRDPRGRRVIGYYGAIADWFDAALVRAVATAHPEALVVLVGGDTGGVGEALADLANVHMVGEVPYAALPYWLHGFDACLLPFKVLPLTMATNPVKVYEYLAAGKPVVSVDLPEMAQFDGLVAIARDSEDFVAAVGRALAARDDEEAAARRSAFAAGQSWSHRAEALDRAIAAIHEPKVSVVVLTYNNLSFTQACLSSIEAHSDYANLEVVVVDNASNDGSPEWLRGWEREASKAGHARRLILNECNAGFSAGNNIGLRAATGEYLIVLNNDTYVTPGWVRTLCAHFRRDPGLGLVGPVTNNIGNEARIEIDYADMEEMVARAGAYTRAHPGMSLPVRNAAFFCVAMPRRVHERVGDMDEAFGIGFFEDDDYCRRVEQAGFRIACAEDVFVHHHLSASFDQLKAATKRELFEKNKVIYEAKWGAWEPHRYRDAVAE